MIKLHTYCSQSSKGLQLTAFNILYYIYNTVLVLMTYISTIIRLIIDIILDPDPDQGQRDGVRERHHVLQGGQRDSRRF